MTTAGAVTCTNSVGETGTKPDLDAVSIIWILQNEEV